MLIDDIVDFCDKKYTTYGDKCGCEGCNHPTGKCSGNCYNCLYHIHFPERAPANAKTLYDCPKMLYHYVCQYSYLYTTELLCAYEEEYDYQTAWMALEDVIAKNEAMDDFEHCPWAVRENMVMKELLEERRG